MYISLLDNTTLVNYGLKKFSNRGHGRGHRHHKNVGLSESVWSKKTDHVKVADGIKLDCDTVSAVGIKVKVDGHCTF